MNSFTEPLAIVLATDGLSAQVLEPFFYEIGCKGSGDIVSIEKGFIADGLTLPKWLPIGRLFAPRWGYLKATLVHDKLCKTHEFVDRFGDVQRLTQSEVDAEFLRCLEALGMSERRAWWYYCFVRMYQIKKHGFEFDGW